MARILCVEDDLNNRTLLREILRRAGFEVLEAGDGYHAQQLLSDESIDLVVLDLRLPGLNGVELTYDIRQNPAIASMPILALTADTANYGNVIEAGCDEFMRKPVHPRAFIEAIQRLLKE